MDDEKFKNLLPSLQELRSFGRKFLESNSIAKVITSGNTPKDEDWIVKLNLQGNQGRLRVSKGDEQFTLFNTPTRLQVGEYGKLRSVARVEEVDSDTVIIKNNFTSLIKIHEWMFDAQNAINNAEKIIDEADEALYTDLSTIFESPLN